jgi:hypothetical protein
MDLKLIMKYPQAIPLAVSLLGKLVKVITEQGKTDKEQIYTDLKALVKDGVALANVFVAIPDSIDNLIEIYLPQAINHFLPESTEV